MITPVYAAGAQVLHQGRHATVIRGNMPDRWGTRAVIGIAYEKEPYGHDVYASEVAPVSTGRQCGMPGAR